MEQQFEIVKASGERELFDPEKLRNSLEKAGASPEQIERIFDELEEKMFEGISTQTIYKLAFSRLKKISRGLAARYKLKQAIRELGPTGFPFEKYVGELLRHQGYKVKTDQMLEGQCVEHEVDVIAVGDHQKHYIECKFHNRQDEKCDVKIPLYINSRFDDLARAARADKQKETFRINGWVVTNTRFTKDAFTYGRCVDLRMVSWDQPEEGSLKRMIELARLYPVTCLNSADASITQKLLDQNIVLCKELHHDSSLIETVTDNSKKKREIIEEVDELCSKKS